MTSTAKALIAYLRAYEAKDLSAIEAMLSEDVRLQDWNLVAEGRSRVVEETRKNFESAQSLKIDVVRLYESESHASAELKIVVNGVVVLDVVDSVSFTSTGAISAIRAYKG